MIYVYIYGYNIHTAYINYFSILCNILYLIQYFLDKVLHNIEKYEKISLTAKYAIKEHNF